MGPRTWIMSLFIAIILKQMNLKWSLGYQGIFIKARSCTIISMPPRFVKKTSYKVKTLRIIDQIILNKRIFSSKKKAISISKPWATISLKRALIPMTVSLHHHVKTLIMRLIIWIRLVPALTQKVFNVLSISDLTLNYDLFGHQKYKRSAISPETAGEITFNANQFTNEGKNP